jgi:hypothetical protein
LPEDKQRIRELLKPWNPYVRRHSALTEKSKILKEHTLRQFASWSTGSNMPQIYLHYFGNESCESLLEAYGITQKAVIIVIEHIMQLAYFYDEQLLYHIPSIVLFRAMNLKISLMLGISAVLTLGVVASPLTISADAGMMYNHQQGIGYAAHYGMNKPGQYAAGTIASLQNDKDGKPAWIVSGLWKASSTNMTSEMSNIVSNASAKRNLPTAAFDAMFDMVRLNGSAMHKHEIHNFTLTGISMPNNKTVVYNGTVTITMKNGPVHGVPVSAKAMDSNVISIWIDPTKTDNHFGNTPIYGTITKAVQIMK